jgi:hypothetical protein
MLDPLVTAEKYVVRFLFAVLLGSTLSLIVVGLIAVRWPDPQADGGATVRLVTSMIAAMIGLAIHGLMAHGLEFARKFGLIAAGLLLAAAAWWLARAIMAFATAARVVG